MLPGQLSDTKVKTTRPDPTRTIRLNDGAGLYLLVTPLGSKLWRWDHTFAGRRNTLAFGQYPTVTPARAREKADQARRLLAHGLDPHGVRFAVVADEWLVWKQTRGRAPKTLRKLTYFVEDYLVPALGRRPLVAIQPRELLTVVRRVEQRGLVETAHRLRSVLNQIFQYAIATERARFNPAEALRDTLAPIRVQHHPAVTDPREIGRLLRAIDAWRGSPVLGAALRLAPYVFVRPGELRYAEWLEFDLDAALWRIPAARMKMRREHLVPLARQAVALLRAHRRLTGTGRLLFPNPRSLARPIPAPRPGKVLADLGYRGTMTMHGFRTTAATRLNELGWPGALIELQLAHIDMNRVRDAYNRAVRLEERARMMQAYADHLDALRDTANTPDRISLQGAKFHAQRKAKDETAGRASD